MPTAVAVCGHRQHDRHKSWERFDMTAPSGGVWDVTRKTGHGPAARCLARPPSAGSAALRSAMTESVRHSWAGAEFKLPAVSPWLPGVARETSPDWPGRLSAHDHRLDGFIGPSSRSQCSR